MTRFLRYIGVLALLLCSLTATAQKFYNLTTGEVQIDSLLPQVGYSFPLGERYSDSIYQARILYPEFIDMTAADIARYKAITTAELPSLPVLDTQVVVEKKRGAIEVSFVPLVYRDGRYQILVSFMLEIDSKPLRRSVRRANALMAPSAPGRYAAHSVLASGKWAKIRVPADGIYQLTSSLIRQAGFSDINKVKVYGYGGHLLDESLPASVVTDFDDLHEVPTSMVSGRRLFYARGPVSWTGNTATRRTRNPYSDYGYYFLTESDAAPATIATDAFMQSFYPSATDYHSLYEEDAFSWYHGGRNLFDSNPVSAGSSHTFTVPAPGPSANATLSVCISAGTASVVSVSCNGQELPGNITISLGAYDKGGEAVRDYVLTDVQSQNMVTITTVSGGPVRLDYISMTTDTPKAAPDLATDNFPVPEYVHNITNQDLHGDGQYDMVIIIPTSQKLLEQARRLADFHEQHDGLRVRIVPADELYNEFSSGTPDATAYRRYMKMLYDRAQTEADQPKYLLLFGDCVWDNRLLTSDCRSLKADDYLLAYESENSFSETDCYVSDDYFCLLDDDERIEQYVNGILRYLGKPDVAVGRFPVVTPTQAKVMVDKTIAYVQNKNAGAWQNTLMFMGDDGNNNIHMDDINDAAEDIATRYPGYLIKKVMWDTYNRVSAFNGFTYPDATAVIKQQQQAGALIMDYGGHGVEYQISHETVLKLSDFKQFTNTNLPLWITASCDIMPFDGVVETIGEEAVLNERGGALAFFGTTRTVYSNYNKSINMAFLQFVLSQVNGKPMSVGEAQRQAKNLLVSSGRDRTANKLQYSLLGDPAVALNLPTATLVVDEINGIAANSAEQVTLKAGSTAVFKGHVEGVSDFRGVVSATVRDSREHIVCKLNDTSKTGAQVPFEFYDRTKTLFQGTDSVRNGQFSFTFAVPKDINYTNGTGLITLHAVNNAHTLEAHGESDRFLIGGSEDASNDSIGPSVYCYLNSPSFLDGGIVNATPYFVAEITDEDGINTTGNGIGHDLQLIIDGDPQKTYVLNDNFSYDFGSYTKGTTWFSIPELEEGLHTLVFRAWDVQNNLSTTRLTFQVVKNLSPTLFDVDVTNNPASTATTFIISHDMTGSAVDVVIDVFDTGGRLLWTHSESGVSMTGAYTVDWDLTVANGHRLTTGVYLYRVRIGSNGSRKASKAKKLIVIGNN